MGVGRMQFLHAARAMSLIVESALTAVAVFSELAIDFEYTAMIATEAFAAGAAGGKVFSPTEMRWRYNESFSHGSTVLAAHADGRKVGQIALIHQRVLVDGREEKAVLLADLFILKKYRSGQVLRDMFREVEEACAREGIKYLLGMPNTKAQPINEHFLKMKAFLKLDIRAGLVGLSGLSGDFVSRRARDLSVEEAAALFSRYALTTDNAMAWTPQNLASRLSGTAHDYVVHYNDRLLAISSARVTRRVPYTLMCGFFPALGAVPTRTDLTFAVRRATAHHRRPIFLYVGHDEVMPSLPGLKLPDWLRPSPMTLDLRDMTTEPGAPGPHIARYQLTDFDFA